MTKQTIKKTLKCLTVAGLLTGIGVWAAGCATSSCSSCKDKKAAEGKSSCGAK